MANEKQLIDLWSVNMNEVDTSDCTDVEDILSAVISYLSELHTVDAVEVVHGCNVYDHDTAFECSVCGWGDWDTLTADSCKYNYCPNCGAKMDLKGE